MEQIERLRSDAAQFIGRGATDGVARAAKLTDQIVDPLGRYGGVAISIAATHGPRHVRLARSGAIIGGDGSSSRRGCEQQHRGQTKMAKSFGWMTKGHATPRGSTGRASL